jgi:hypothetical protein
MLGEFDQGTIANIASALEFACQMIPADKDINELRKRIADELIHSAGIGKHTLTGLKQSGMKIVNETAKPRGPDGSGCAGRKYRLNTANMSECFRSLLVTKISLHAARSRSNPVTSHLFCASLSGSNSTVTLRGQWRRAPSPRQMGPYLAGVLRRLI